MHHNFHTPIPYISVVAAARNDDHGGNMLGRMQAFATSWVHQSTRFGLHSEVIVVDWNPPPDRPPLSQALDWPSSDHCQMRFLTVPVEVHARLPHATVPLHQ